MIDPRSTSHPATAAAAEVPAYHRPLVSHAFEGNRIVQRTGCRYPIFNAPVGYFARAQLAGAVSAAGGMGLMPTNAAGLAETAAEYDVARGMSDAPLGLQMFLRMLKGQERVDEVLDWVLDGRTGLARHVRRRPDADRRPSKGRRRAALPPDRQRHRRPAGGRRRRRRADRRGRRERRVAGRAFAAPVRPAAAGAGGRRRALDRRRRHRRRPRHGRRLRPRRRGRDDGHAVHELGRRARCTRTGSRRSPTPT